MLKHFKGAPLPEKFYLLLFHISLPIIPLKTESEENLISDKEGATAMSKSVGILRTCEQMEQPDTASINNNPLET